MSASGVDSLEAAREALAQRPPSLMLLDSRIDGGLELLQQLGRQHPLLPVVVVLGSADAAPALQALGAHGTGHEPGDGDIELLGQALYLALAGVTGRPPPMPNASDGERVVAPSDDRAGLPLTQGLSNKSIARELGVSVETVKDHVAAVLKALGVGSRTRAAVVATQKMFG